MKNNELDKLKNLWQSHTDNSDIDMTHIIPEARKQLKAQHKAMLISNIFVSISFVAVFIVILGVGTSFPDRSIYFYASLGAMGLLLVSLLAGMWAGVRFRNINSDMEPRRYIDSSIKKLKIRHFMLKYATPGFLILLLLVFMFYYADLFEGESEQFKILAYGITVLYFLIITVLMRKKRSRQLKEIVRLLQYLNLWKDNLKDEQGDPANEDTMSSMAL